MARTSSRRAEDTLFSLVFELVFYRDTHIDEFDVFATKVRVIFLFLQSSLTVKMAHVSLDSLSRIWM